MDIRNFFMERSSQALEWTTQGGSVATILERVQGMTGCGTHGSGLVDNVAMSHRLIHLVVQGMQIAALPTDPELATEKFGQIPKVSKIMKLEEGEDKSKAVEVLAKFEEQIKEEKIVSRKYCEILQEEWDEYNELEEG
ncbi:hypothetical protein DUI87_11328 [Hirundo rustica rustica]|uniref:Uncharacterized protein n=1 Tax=Hirundo rustica rustica TaxID=333673 RepID=A0A3M0KG89_HIRRU|nr:hypothetical protein DUI87_11328 [Hirundo rustica rustica]